jgi:hypothetical protein
MLPLLFHCPGRGRRRLRSPLPGRKKVEGTCWPGVALRSTRGYIRRPFQGQRGTGLFGSESRHTGWLIPSSPQENLFHADVGKGEHGHAWALTLLLEWFTLFFFRVHVTLHDVLDDCHPSPGPGKGPRMQPRVSTRGKHPYVFSTRPGRGERIRLPLPRQCERIASFPWIETRGGSRLSRWDRKTGESLREVL